MALKFTIHVAEETQQCILLRYKSNYHDFKHHSLPFV